MRSVLSGCLFLVLLSCSMVKVIHVDPEFDQDTFSGSSLAVCHINGAWGRIRQDSMKTAQPNDLDVVPYRKIPDLFFEELKWMRPDLRLVSPSYTRFYDAALPEKMHGLGTDSVKSGSDDSVQVHAFCGDLRVRYLIVFDTLSLSQITHVASGDVDVEGKERTLLIGLQVWDLRQCRVVYQVRREHKSGGDNWTGDMKRHIRNVSMEIIRTFPKKKKGWTEPVLLAETENPVQAIQIGHAGIFRKGMEHELRTVPDWYPAESDSLVQETDSIPATPGLSFGFTYTLSAPDSHGVNSAPVFCKLYFPRVLVNPDVEGGTDEWSGIMRMQLNKPVFTGFTFRREWELAAGKWSFEVICGKQRAYKTFFVYVP